MSGGQSPGHRPEQAPGSLQEARLPCITKDAGGTEQSGADGCEVSLLEAAGAYRTLAAGGNYSIISWIEEPLHLKKCHIKQGSSFDDRHTEGREEAHAAGSYSAKRTVIAFKTGTSYGLRMHGLPVTKPYT